MGKRSLVARAGADRLAAAVRAVPMFRGLSDEDVARIAAVAGLRRLKRAETLWNAGDPADALTVVVEGRIKVVRHAEGGDVILEIFEEGEPVGAIAVYSGIPYPASAVCLEPATLLTIPRRDYFALLEDHPGLTRGILRELTKLCLALTHKLGELRGPSVEGRIARLFLSLARRMGRRTAEGIVIPIHLSRQEVAQMVGTTVESAIRVLSRWGREGLLVSGEKRFILPSRRRLAARVGVEPEEGAV